MEEIISENLNSHPLPFPLPPNANKQDYVKRYRELQKQFHTDRGSGDNYTATILNVVWESIKEEKGWK